MSREKDKSLSLEVQPAEGERSRRGKWGSNPKGWGPSGGVTPISCDPDVLDSGSPAGSRSTQATPVKSPGARLSPTSHRSLTEDVVHQKLSNGLTLLIKELHAAPVVAIDT